MLSRRTLLAAATGLGVGSVTGCGASGGGARPTPDADSPSASAVESRSGTGRETSSTGESPSGAAPSASPSTTPSAARSTPARTSVRPPRPELRRTVARDLDVPWGIVFLRSGDAIVSERGSGHLVHIATSGRVSTLGRVAGVEPPSGLGEGGLLGIALAPGDEDTLYAYVTTSSDNRVVRLSIAGGRVGRPHPVLRGIPTSTHHHGGRLLFDRTGHLLVTTGDAERPDSAQDKRSLAGKILRIRPDGRAAAGNPFGNRVWTYGHRNIEGLAFDANSRLWATEFGDKSADELNLITRGGNYGWPRVEGRSSSHRYVSPALTWSPTSTCSPAGLAITRSTAFVGSLQGHCLFAVPLHGLHAGKAEAHFRGTHGRIRSVVVAPDGALWITTSNTDGRTTPGRHDDKILRVSL